MQFIYKVPGYILLLFGGFCLSWGGLVVRSFDDVSVWQILFLRSFFFLIALLVFLLIIYKKNTFKIIKDSGFPAIIGGLFLSLSIICCPTKGTLRGNIALQPTYGGVRLCGPTSPHAISLCMHDHLQILLLRRHREHRKPHGVHKHAHVSWSAPFLDGSRPSRTRSARVRTSMHPHVSFERSNSKTTPSTSLIVYPFLKP